MKDFQWHCLHDSYAPVILSVLDDKDVSSADSNAIVMDE